MKPKIELMVDSGAYSAYTIGRPVNIDKYAAFVQKNKDYIFCPVNLDTLNYTDSNASAEGSYKNWCYLRDKGVITMPVFHVREDIKWLDKMLEEAPYVGISGTMAAINEAYQFFDMVFNYITNTKGEPIRKYHSFGNTAEFTMKGYPFYSADSTTWALAGGRAGRVIVDSKSYQIGVRTRAVDRAFIEKDSKEFRDHLVQMNLKPDTLDKDLPERIFNMLRCYIWIQHFQNLAANCPRIYKPNSKILIAGNKYAPDSPGIEVEPMKMFFGMPGSPAVFLPPLTMAGVEGILISFFYITPKGFDLISKYVCDPIDTCMHHPKMKDYFEQCIDLFIDPDKIPGLKKYNSPKEIQCLQAS